MQHNAVFYIVAGGIELFSIACFIFEHMFTLIFVFMRILSKISVSTINYLHS